MQQYIRESPLNGSLLGVLNSLFQSGVSQVVLKKCITCQQLLCYIIKDGELDSDISCEECESLNEYKEGR